MCQPMSVIQHFWGSRPTEIFAFLPHPYASKMLSTSTSATVPLNSRKTRKTGLHNRQEFLAILCPNER